MYLEHAFENVGKLKKLHCVYLRHAKCLFLLTIYIIVFLVLRTTGLYWCSTVTCAKIFGTCTYEKCCNSLEARAFAGQGQVVEIYFSPFNGGDRISLMAPMTTYMAVPSHWLAVEWEETTENNKLPGSDHSQCLHIQPIYTHRSVHWLWWSVGGNATHCLSGCDATGAMLCWSLPFPWTTWVSWRREACYMGNSWPSCLDCPGLHSGESTSVCGSMVSGDWWMPATATTTKHVHMILIVQVADPEMFRCWTLLPVLLSTLCPSGKDPIYIFTICFKYKSLMPQCVVVATTVQCKSRGGEKRLIIPALTCNPPFQAWCLVPQLRIRFDIEWSSLNSWKCYSGRIPGRWRAATRSTFGI